MYLTEVTQKGNELQFVMYGRAPVNVTLIETFVNQFHGRMSFRPEKEPLFIYRHPVVNGQGITDPAGLIGEILEKMKMLY